MKKCLSLCMAAILAFTCFLGGCAPAQDPVETLEVVPSTDKYRNVYQIFVNSFCDSDGNGVGDLQGIISKLDYLNDGDPNTSDDLGVDAIWLTPIMPSPSYHKYDVTDYYNIDETFGTLEDFDELVAACGQRGIRIIMDMVLNHCSDVHPWFEQACEEVKQGKLDGYAKYFQIKDFGSDGPANPQAYTEIADGYWYESNFSPKMPEWNLNSDATREEFEKIAKFWIDRGVDGFRLDAVKYFNNASTDGKEFLKWYYDTCKAYKEDIYMVGENWSDPADIYDMYASGIDSQFCFKFATTSGAVINAVRIGKDKTLAKKVMNYNNKVLEENPDAIQAMFLSNHDMVRSGNALESLGVSYEKMAAALYMLFPGNSYIYYGEEIGITAPQTDRDTYYRTPMVWDSENLPDMQVDGIDTVSVPEWGGVEQQQKDPDSLLNFYKRIIKIKNQNPEIARGKITEVQDFDDDSVCAYYIEYEDSKLLIVHNLSAEEEKSLTLSEDMLANPQTRGTLTASASAEQKTQPQLSGNNLKLPVQSTIILKESK